MYALNTLRSASLFHFPYTTSILMLSGYRVWVSSHSCCHWVGMAYIFSYDCYCQVSNAYKWLHHVVSVSYRLYAQRLWAGLTCQDVIHFNFKCHVCLVGWLVNFWLGSCPSRHPASTTVLVDPSLVSHGPGLI